MPNFKSLGFLYDTFPVGGWAGRQARMDNNAKLGMGSELGNKKSWGGSSSNL